MDVKIRERFSGCQLTGSSYYRLCELEDCTLQIDTDSYVSLDMCVLKNVVVRCEVAGMVRIRNCELAGVRLEGDFSESTMEIGVSGPIIKEEVAVSLGEDFVPNIDDAGLMAITFLVACPYSIAVPLAHIMLSKGTSQWNHTFMELCPVYRPALAAWFYNFLKSRGRRDLALSWKARALSIDRKWSNMVLSDYKWIKTRPLFVFGIFSGHKNRTVFLENLAGVYPELEDDMSRIFFHVKYNTGTLNNHYLWIPLHPSSLAGVIHEYTRGIWDDHLACFPRTSKLYNKIMKDALSD